MKSQKKAPSHLRSKRRRLDLNTIVALLDNKAFLADSREYWNHYRVQSERIGTDREAWERQAEEFMGKYLDPFTKKWMGAYPAHDQLLSSPLWQEKDLAIRMAARWGIIPIFPWTTKNEAMGQLKQIQRKIGKSHKDQFKAIRTAQIASWLREFFVSERTGKSPTLREIAIAVWGRKKGLRRPTTEEAIEKISEDKESALMQRYIREGNTRKKAQRLTYRSARGSEPPAISMVRMALRRLKERKTSGVPIMNHQKADQLGLAITLLLKELPLSESSSSNLAAIRRCAVDFGNLLLPPEPLP